MDIKLGDLVQDQISGFIGVVTAVSTYLNGCTQMCVVPKVDKEGKKVDAEWFDFQRLTVLDRGVVAVHPAAATEPGGPQPHPPSTVGF